MKKLINCSICGKFHETAGFLEICPQCYEQDMKDFDRIRQFLFLHPRAKVFEVSCELDMPIPKIKRYLREGRLEIVEKDHHFLKCETCGRPICSGKQCEACQKQSHHDYKTASAGIGSKKAGNSLNYLPLSRSARY